MKQKGFTLIELLVVIAIIGILASVVLASLNSARNKGADAAVKANLANMRAQAEIYNDTNSGYSSAVIATLPATSCSTANSLFDSTQENNLTSAVSAAQTASGNTATCVLGGTSGAKADKWAVAIGLKTTGSYWCVDSTGVSRGATSAGATYTGVTPGAAPAAVSTAGTCN
ncbi:MAG: prepilin-type N-terminal cleavage/methylation domain-containing protein [Minisyncoccota bacterium]